MTLPRLHPIPPTWEWRELGDFLASIDAGKSFKCEERPPRSDEVGVLKVSAVTWGAFNAQESKTCTDPARVEPRYFVRSGDFLLSRANTIDLVGNSVIVHAVAGRLMLSDKLLRLGFAGIDPRWVLFALRTPHGRSEIQRLATGNQESMRNIGQDRIRQIRVPVAPPSEQTRIVAEIEKQFTRLDAGVEALKRLQAHLRRYRAAVLKAAFRSRGGADGDLPRGWVRAPLGDVVEILDRLRVPINADERAGRQGAVPYYGATGQVGWIDKHLFDEELVLLGEDGAPFLDPAKPKAYLIRGKSWVNNHAHVLRGKDVSNPFLMHQLNGTDFHGAVTGTTRLKLPQAPMKKLLLVIPPRAEQDRIVAYVDEKLTQADAVQRAVADGMQRSFRLRSAILRAAFEVQLVEPSRSPAISSGN